MVAEGVTPSALLYIMDFGSCILQYQTPDTGIHICVLQINDHFAEKSFAEC